jgi:hypothetical protein
VLAGHSRDSIKSLEQVSHHVRGHPLGMVPHWLLRGAKQVAYHVISHHLIVLP